jgi:ketosteroid isomerase-like protein
MADESQFILELEERRYQSLLSNDIAALEELLDDRLVYTHSNAVRDTKASLIKKLADGALRYERIEHPVDQVILRGDVAVVIGRMRATVVSAGETKNLDNVATAVWVRGENGWRFLAYGPTPLP